MSLLSFEHDGSRERENVTFGFTSIRAFPVSGAGQKLGNLTDRLVEVLETWRAQCEHPDKEPFGSIWSMRKIYAKRRRPADAALG